MAEPFRAESAKGRKPQSEFDVWAGTMQLNTSGRGQTCVGQGVTPISSWSQTGERIVRAAKFSDTTRSGSFLKS